MTKTEQEKSEVPAEGPSIEVRMSNEQLREFLAAKGKRLVSPLWELEQKQPAHQRRRSLMDFED
ncbi:MAG: hypothetical protein JWQ99_1317 [Blastococcus sp.]|jgi:hypothetical protein|nr:hypothetical protein [Blastococcus sp.]